ncbi:immunoglobulin-like domain-containing protein [Clostridium chrysemydis]|uniref:immunoglobulin-like domain-containing protein n=1 Tax=Clostridium chrysemydis TaxID=2665504 RepID=UPI0018846C90|nr:immunoglobulin-like domain-containing protein [Clostridium chrysemydis]
MKKEKLKKIIAVTIVTSVVFTGILPVLEKDKAYAQDKQAYSLEKAEAYKSFGVGQGIEWPSQVYSPYVDMVAWINNPDYSNNGTVNLKKIYEETGVKFFNLGFIQGTSGITNGKVNWGWGGYSLLSESGGDNSQYNGIKKSIKELRDVGGDVTVSFGGLNGTPFWQVTQDVDVLYNTYMELVKGYGLTRLDLDIEGGAQDKTKNIANAKAIKKVQDETGVDIVLTLPVLPSGLTSVQLDVLEAYLSQGVKVELVNIMTMCYGSSTLNPGENYGTASLRAVDSTKDQLKNYFKKYANIDLTDAESYRKIGTTPSIGFEGSAHPVFTTDWTKLVVDHAKLNGLGMVSFWSLNRDAKLDNNSGVKNQYEFTNICKEFTGGGSVEVNNKPVISGAQSKTIYIGDNFNPLDGVKAVDKEDGDLTSKIQVTGKVDTGKAGYYDIVYKVSDSKGLETTLKITIEVKAKPDPSKDNYDSSKIYNTGDKVIFKGEEYVCKWWVKGEDPDKSAAWEKVNSQNPDGTVDYKEGMVCTAGMKVRYEGKVYEALWWTTSVPGSDSSWKLIR